MEGMISRSGESTESAKTRRIRAMSMRRLGSPALSRSGCVVLYGEWSSHMMQCRLQSSGLVSNVMRHGPGLTPDVGFGNRRPFDVRSHYPPLCLSRFP